MKHKRWSGGFLTHNKPCVSNRWSYTGYLCQWLWRVSCWEWWLWTSGVFCGLWQAVLLFTVAINWPEFACGTGCWWIGDDPMVPICCGTGCWWIAINWPEFACGTGCWWIGDDPMVPICCGTGCWWIGDDPMVPIWANVVGSGVILCTTGLLSRSWHDLHQNGKVSWAS